MSIEEMSITEISETAEFEKSLLTKKFPTLKEFFMKTKDYYTKDSSLIYATLEWFSPLKLRLAELYYLATDTDEFTNESESYLRKSNCNRYVFSYSEFGFSKQWREKYPMGKIKQFKVELDISQFCDIKNEKPLVMPKRMLSKFPYECVITERKRRTFKKKDTELTSGEILFDDPVQDFDDDITTNEL